MYYITGQRGSRSIRSYSLYFLVGKSAAPQLLPRAETEKSILKITLLCGSAVLASILLPGLLRSVAQLYRCGYQIQEEMLPISQQQHQTPFEIRVYKYTS